MVKRTEKFRVEPAPKADVGHWRIRLSKENRGGARRHCLLKITHGDASGYFVGLGHNKGDNVVQADFDVREQLGIEKCGSTVELTIEDVKGCQVFCWYLRHRDPYVHVPAIIAVLSFIIGAAGIILGLIGAWPAIKALWGTIISIISHVLSCS